MSVAWKLMSKHQRLKALERGIATAAEIRSVVEQRVTEAARIELSAIKFCYNENEWSDVLVDVLMHAAVVPMQILSRAGLSDKEIIAGVLNRFEAEK